MAGAYAKASEFGYKGTMFAWESAVTGTDQVPTAGSAAATCPGDCPTPPSPLLIHPTAPQYWFGNTGQLEHHVTADIGNALEQHWLATRNTSWLAAVWPVTKGIADFWASRVSPCPALAANGLGRTPTGARAPTGDETDATDETDETDDTDGMAGSDTTGGGAASSFCIIGASMRNALEPWVPLASRSDAARMPLASDLLTLGAYLPSRARIRLWSHSEPTWIPGSGTRRVPRKRQ